MAAAGGAGRRSAKIADAPLPREGVAGRGAGWLAHLLWEQPQESAVRSHIPAGTARPSLAQSGGVCIQDYPSIVTRPTKGLFPRREDGK